MARGWLSTVKDKNRESSVSTASLARFGLADDQERIRDGVFALTWAVHGRTGHPQLSGFAPIQVHGIGAAQSGHVIREFGELHAHGEAGLPSVNDDEIDMCRAPTYR